MIEMNEIFFVKTLKIRIPYAYSLFERTNIVFEQKYSIIVNRKLVHRKILDYQTNKYLFIEYYNLRVFILNKNTL